MVRITKKIKNETLAHQLLRFKGNEIRVNGVLLSKRILLPRENFTPIEQSWPKGKAFLETGKKLEIIGLEDLKKLGWNVIATFAEGKKYLDLARNREHYAYGSYEVTEPQLRSYQIQYDPTRKIVRLIGPAVYTKEWRNIERKKREIEIERDIYGKPKIDRNYYKKLLFMRSRNSFETEEIERFKIHPEHIAMLITYDNKLVAVPKNDDISKIGVTGKTRFGKSFLLHGLVDQIYWKLDQRMIVGNDPMNQFHALHLPSDSFSTALSLWGMHPRGLPTLNFHLKHPSVKHQYQYKDFDYGVDYSEFLNKYGYFTYGISKYQLGGPVKYLATLKYAFLKCKTKEDIKNAMMANMKVLDEKGKEKAGMVDMVNKWADAFDSIFKEGFLNLDKVKWEYKKGREWIEEDPLFVCMETGIVPDLNTSAAKRSASFRNIMANLLLKTIDYQVRTGRKRMWTVWDEVGDFFKKGKNRRDNLANAMEEFFTQGGFNNMGCLYSIQSYKVLHEEIRANTSYMLTAYLQNKEERSMLAKDYELTAEAEKKISKLNRFEFMLATKEPVIVYDQEGKSERIDEGGGFVGRCLPPLSKHMKPSEMQGEMVEEAEEEPEDSGNNDES